MMAKLVDKLPEGENWTYEVKRNGYRALLLKNRDHVQLRSRNDNNLTPAIGELRVSCWCGRGDSNPHGIATASPSS
jgi:ATP-dependent DNA ligase